MKKGFKEIVAWQYDGRTAIGVLYDWDDYVSVAVNYFMDSNINEGDLWYMDSIYKDEGTEVRQATEVEVRTLIKALDEHKLHYAYDAKTNTIRYYDVYPTMWMKIKDWFKRKLNL